MPRVQSKGDKKATRRAESCRAVSCRAVSCAPHVPALLIHSQRCWKGLVLALVAIYPAAIHSSTRLAILQFHHHSSIVSREKAGSRHVQTTFSAALCCCC